MFIKEHAFIISVTTLSLALRLFNLDFQSIWMDEGFSIYFSNGSVVESLRKIMVMDVHPPRYYLLLNFWTSTFGTSDFSIRLPGALLSTLTIPLVWCLGKKMFNVATARYAVILATVSTYSIQLAQEARPYALLGLLSTASMLAYVNVLDRKNWTSVALLSIVNSALLYTNYFGIFVLIAQALLSFRHLLVSNLVTLIIFSPWVVQSLSNLQRFQHESHVKMPMISDFFEIFLVLLSKGKLDQALPIINAGAMVFLSIVFVLLVVPKLHTASDYFCATTGAASRNSNERALLVLWLMIPVVVSWVVSQLGLRVFHAKSLIVAAPALWILVGYLLTRLKFRKLAVVLLVTNTLNSVVQYPRKYLRPHRPDFRSATEFIVERVGFSEKIVIDPGFAWPAVLHYAKNNPINLTSLEDATQYSEFWFMDVNKHQTTQFQKLRQLGYRGIKQAEFWKINVWQWHR